MAVYLDYDQKALDDQYTQAVWVPDNTPYTEVSARLGEEARASLDYRADIPYGERPEELLDIFVPKGAAGAPVRVFYHGGSWLQGTKHNGASLAKLHVDAGALLVAVNFVKASEAHLDEIVRQSRAAVAWVYRNIAEYGGDPDKIMIGGRSSGGHQGGTVLTADWSEFGLPADVIKGAVLTSGMYDLEPVRLSVRNNFLHLDEEAARRNSAIHHIPERGCHAIIAHAENDSDEFRRQSRAFAAAWAAHGHPLTYLPLAGENHFSTDAQMADPDSVIGRAMVDQIRRVRDGAVWSSQTG
jgi:arylformamidase